MNKAFENKKMFFEVAAALERMTVEMALVAG
jgi:hypothetical protein